MIAGSSSTRNLSENFFSFPLWRWKFRAAVAQKSAGILVRAPGPRLCLGRVTAPAFVDTGVSLVDKSNIDKFLAEAARMP
jgi:hypothetical protein